MGICSSFESTHVATAKVILHDGRLQEYPYPVKASYVLQRINQNSFICNSDEMEFDDVVSAVNDNDDLLPGNLYFALPLTKLKYPLQADEMAALAVKASSALMKSGDKCGCRRRNVTPVVFSGEKPVSRSNSGGSRTRSGSGGGGRRQFTAMLKAIPE